MHIVAKCLLYLGYKCEYKIPSWWQVLSCDEYLMQEWLEGIRTTSKQTLGKERHRRGYNAFKDGYHNAVCPPLPVENK